MSEQLSTLAVKSQILLAQTSADIARCFPVLQELRPKQKDQEALTNQILRQNQQGYILSYVLDDGEVGACMGFRIFETLAWGKIIYIDDLVTREKSRKNGFGRMLLEYAIEQGRLENCAEIHLDTGYQRHDAHRLYLNMGFTLNCHHLVLAL